MKTQDPLKPAGVWEVRRRIRVPALVDVDDAMAVERAIRALPGVRKVVTEVDKHRIGVRYDATQSTYQAVVEVLGNIGFPPLDDWWSRFKGNMYQFSDTNARDNAKAPTPACCNKPPR